MRKKKFVPFESTTTALYFLEVFRKLMTKQELGIEVLLTQKIC